MTDIVSLMVDFALKYSYLGVFLISIISNMILFFPVPYLAALLVISATTNLNPVFLALASGLGSGLGKLFAYFVGYSGRRLLKEDRRKGLNALAKIVGKGGMIAALIVSVTPLPDDIVLVPLGTIKYSLWKFWAATTIGKTFLAIATCYFGTAISILLGTIGGSPWISAGTSIAIVLIGMIIILKVNWIKIAAIVDVEGLRGLVQRVRAEGLRWLFT